MLKRLACMALPIVLSACGAPDTTAILSVSSNMNAYIDTPVTISGTRVPRNNNIQYVSLGVLDYLSIEDDSGRINIWYDVTRRRCPPRLGATVTVTGKVVVSDGPQPSRQFVAQKLSVDNEPPLRDNEIRLCSLSLNEQQIHAMEGLEALHAYWRDEGEPERELIYD